MLIFIYNGKMTGPFLYSPFIENIGNHLVPAVHTVIFLRMFSIDPDFLCLYRLKKEHFRMFRHPVHKKPVNAKTIILFPYGKFFQFQLL